MSHEQNPEMIYSFRELYLRQMEKQCSVHGCNKPAKGGSQGMCGMHAQRVRRYGDPNYVTPEAQRRANSRKAQLVRVAEVKPTTYRKLHGRHEHRVIAEQMLGRPLMRNEIVHHIDGNKHNNDPSNLQVMTQSEHVREHWYQGAKPIIWNGKQYWPRQWAEELGLPLTTVWNRLRAGWSLERIANTPRRSWTKKNA
jgi:hypothetical protein